MTEMALGEKSCSKCGETKSLGEFYRRSSNGRRSASCKGCDRQASVAAKERRRATIGDEALRARQREATRAHRERTNGSYDKRYRRAKQSAIDQLIARHEREFQALFSTAKHEERLG